MGTAGRIAALAASSMVLAAGVAAGEASPRARYQSLNAVRVAAKQVYYVKELQIRRDVVRLSFIEGKLAFLDSCEGRLTGAVFTGRGHVLAMPRDPIEKHQLARFLGSPLLDQSFSRAYLRFTDNTAQELLQRLQDAGARTADEPAFAAEWDPVVAELNPSHSLRILNDWLAEQPRPYFYAGLEGAISGAFDIVLDNRWTEQVLLGQPRWVSGARYYDVWASFRRSDGAETFSGPFAPVDYAIETTLRPDRTMESTTLMTLKAVGGGERMVPLELSRFLSVLSVEDSENRPLTFFQNEAVNRHEIAQRGNDTLLVILPIAARKGEPLRLRVRYRGSVISDAGNGVFYVGDRGSWYPHVSGTGRFARFDLLFRWPRRLQLVATGRKLEEREEGDWRIGRWRSDTPTPVAGFNVGDYSSVVVDSGKPRVELYANRQLEQAILERVSRKIVLQQPPPFRQTLPRTSLPPVLVVTEPPPSPVAVLKQMAQEIADATRYFERWNGPFPYDPLAVSQIPGSLGQGWPGLVYLPTLAFLPPEAQQRAGVSARTQEQLTELVLYHEVAHQWWGNLVSWEHYQDQWIHEGLANYIALLYANTKKASDRSLSAWLGRYRDELLTKGSSETESAEEAGPLAAGYRLRSSKSPQAYDQIVYGKGAWVFHMLRMMLRDPVARDPDARFARLLRKVLDDHRFGVLTTEDLQRAVEQVMKPEMALEGGRSMDWFFDQWVRGTDIPVYSVKFTVRPQGKGFVVRGTLKQSRVPENFLAAVPIYAARPGGKPVSLGTVVTSGAETPFHFVSPVHPKRLLIDPQLTLLCRTE